MLRVLLLVTLLSPLLPAAAEAPSTEGMVFVPGGRFIMGTDEGEKPTNASPAHPVVLEPFWIDRYEVTNREYAAFIEAKGYEKPEYWSEAGREWLKKVERRLPVDWEKRKKALGKEFDQHPAVGVSWFEAEAFARYSKKRLPTEAEWERAARGTDGRRFPWGDAFNPVMQEKTSGTLPVGEPKEDRSAAGIFGMGSNVSEWTSSWFDGYPGTKFKSRYWGKDAKRRYRVARGASWHSLGQTRAAAEHRAAATFRIYQYGPDNGYTFIGFRLAMDGKPPKPE